MVGGLAVLAGCVVGGGWVGCVGWLCALAVWVGCVGWLCGRLVVWWAGDPDSSLPTIFSVAECEVGVSGLISAPD